MIIGTGGGDGPIRGFIAAFVFVLIPTTGEFIAPLYVGREFPVPALPVRRTVLPRMV